MSVRITTYMDGPAPALDRLPEARAVCDGCGASGPPVGTGIVFHCLDCGSHRLAPTRIADPV